MAARAIWKGRLRIGKAAVAVRLVSAAVDKRVHFRLLHERDEAPLRQEMVNPETGEVVPRDQVRRGYPAPDGTFVILSPAELAELEPPESRDIHVKQFVPIGTLGPAWFVRPYYLADDGNRAEYTALARALAHEKRDGIASWVMRKKAYVGVLRAEGDALVLVTLRRAEELIAVEEVTPGRTREPSAKEREMAEQLISMFEGDFVASEYRDEYRDRVLGLVQAKARGKRPSLPKPPRKAPEKDLMSALAASLKRARQRKAA